MSDLAATNCGCEGNNSCSLIWIILLLNCLCGGNNGVSLLSNNGGADAQTADASILSVVIHGGGYGHGNGMSQCGAAALAEKGLDYREIFEYYYQCGVEAFA